MEISKSSLHSAAPLDEPENALRANKKFTRTKIFAPFSGAFRVVLANFQWGEIPLQFYFVQAFVGHTGQVTSPAFDFQHFLPFQPAFQMVAYAYWPYPFWGARIKQITCLQRKEPGDIGNNGIYPMYHLGR